MQRTFSAVSNVYHSVAYRWQGDDPPSEHDIACARLQSLIDEEKRTLTSLGKEAQKELSSQEYYKRSNQDLEGRIKKSNADLTIIEEDIKATTANAPDEATLSAREATQVLQGVLVDIENLSERILAPYRDRLHTSSPDRWVYMADLRDAYDSHQLASSGPYEVLKACEKFLKRVSMPFVIPAFVQHLLSHHIIRLVFTSMSPGHLDDEDSRLLFINLLTSIRKEESQDDAARWRAMTHLHYRKEVEWKPQAERILKELSIVLNPFGELALTDELVYEVVKVLSQATSIRYMVEQQCMEADFKFTIPKVWDSYNPALMECLARDSRYEIASCVMPVSAALRASYKETGKLVYFVCVRASVLTDASRTT